MAGATGLIDWFRASAGYINAHRGKVFVALLGGDGVADPNLPDLLRDLGLLHSLGIQLVLVHGARPQIDAALRARKLPGECRQGLRVTPAASMQCVKEVAAAITVDLQSMFTMMPGHTACQGNFVTAKPLGIHDGTDFHYTGTVRKIHAEAIRGQLALGHSVLLSNLGHSLTGEAFNLTAEEVATETAIALAADKFILFIADDGLRDERGNVIANLDAETARERLQRLGEGDDGARTMADRLAAALRAHENGVHRCHLISHSENGALLRELFSREGRGSLLGSDGFDRLRRARGEDIADILGLIQPLEASGTLVARSRELLESEIDFFHVIELEGAPVACAALYPIDGEAAELACIAVHPLHRRRGFGERLLRHLEGHARQDGIARLFALTTVADHWFLQHGFEPSWIDELPQERQRLYNYQRNSKVLKKNVGKP